MLWIKAFHIIFMVTWFAGLFYLPRLFVYYAMAEDDAVRQTLRVMQRRLMVMTHIGGSLTWLFGLGLVWVMPMWLYQGWMHVKLGLVLMLTIYHFWCGRIVKDLAKGEAPRSDEWYRWFNEVPTLILMAAVILVVLKPF